MAFVFTPYDAVGNGATREKYFCRSGGPTKRIDPFAPAQHALCQNANLERILSKAANAGL